MSAVVADDLAKLLTDESEINRTLLSETLLPFVRIGKESGTPIFTPEYSKLTNSGKIVVYLLARKAAVAVGVLKGEESATPQEISSATGIPYDSVKPTASELARKNVLGRDAGRYLFPNHLILQARGLIK